MNATSTPSPTHGTQRWLIEAARQGDRAATEELIRRYEPLVQRVVWDLRPPLGCEREDLAQESRIALVAAIRAWRPERGPFPAFADRCVSNRALLAVAAAGRHKHQILSRAMSFYDDRRGPGSPPSDPGALRPHDDLAIAGPRTEPEARLLAREALNSLLHALPTLTPNERRALAGTLDGQSYDQIGPTIGGTPKAASQAAYRARRKLAAALPKAA